MNKEEFLQELIIKINTGEITHQEILDKIGLNNPASTIQVSSEISSEKTNKFFRFSVTKMLYVLGAVVITVGIIIFVGQIWIDIGSFGRIIVTLILGLFIAFLGSILLKQKPQDSLGAVFHSIGGILIPVGVFVTLNEFASSYFSLWPITIAFGFVFIFYWFLIFIHKHSVITFFTIAEGTMFLYLLLGAIFESFAYSADYFDQAYVYLTVFIGASYFLLAHSFKEGWNKKLVGTLCFFGSAFSLGGAFWHATNSILWQLFYPLFVSGVLYLSIYMKSKSILFMSTIFTIIYISYITSKYFAGSLGWPISLVILGFLFIGLGYFSLEINRRYIKDTSKSTTIHTSE